jgi:PIN domain nuclease of toxin-antitoxin system
MAGEAHRIGEKARAAIEAGGDGIAISAVTIWEVAIKRGLGKLEAPDDLLQQLERAAVDLLPITAQHADLVASLPPHHRDPFDRLLVAQATAERFMLATADEELSAYGIEVVWQ